MSWSANFNLTDGEVVEESVVESNIEPDYHNDQYQDALDATWDLIRSGSLGDPKGNFRVVITGHGNENHEPAAGWSNDFISIAVYQT